MERGVSNARRRLQELFDSKQYYEAQQTVRMLYHRYLSRKLYDEAKDILVHAIEQFFSLKEYGMAGDLSKLLPEFLQQSQAPRSPENIALLHRIFKLFETDGGKYKFAALAKEYEQEKDYSSSQDYFLQSGTDPEMLAAFGRMLVDWSQEGHESELGLFVARPVLQIALLADGAVAEHVLSAFVAAHPSLAGANPPYADPLLNFVRYLALTIQRDARPLFELLTRRYSAVLAQDPELSKYLTKIGERYFGIQQAPSLGNMLGSLMRGMMAPRA